MFALDTNSLSEKNTAAKKDLSNYKILVADDSADMRNLFKLILEQAGAIVDFAIDGDEVIEFAQAQRYDAILMDLAMPKISGEEASRILKSLGLNMPIIVTSGFINRNEYVAKGFDGVLPKPFELKEVVRVISSCILNKK